MRGRFRGGIAAILVGGAIVGGLMTQSGGGPSVPPGVTLTQADGGASYYGNWSGPWVSTWNSPNFLPIAAFIPYDLGATRPNGMTGGAGLVDAGINTIVAPANGMTGATVGGTDGDKIVSNGLWAIEQAFQNEVTGSALTTAQKNRVVGWLTGDEMDSHDCGDADILGFSWLNTGSCTNVGNSGGFGTYISQAFLNTRMNNLRAADTARMAYQGYTHNWAFALWKPESCQAVCTGLTTASDLLSYDVYMLVDPRTGNTGADPDFGLDEAGLTSHTGKVWSAYDSIMTARDMADNVKPIMPDVEVSETDSFNTAAVVPSAAQIKALVWNYIVGGARGIQYFNKCACEYIGKSSDDVINDTTQWPTVHGAVKAVNAQLIALAPVINAEFASGYVTASGGGVDSGVNVMAKWMPSENAFYVFATPKQAASQNVTFTFAGTPTGTVTGVGPSTGSTWTLNGSGQITVSFADANDAKVFKVPR